MNTQEETAMIRHVRWALQCAADAGTVLQEAQAQPARIAASKKEEALALAQNGKAEMDAAARIFDARIDSEPDIVLMELGRQYQKLMRVLTAYLQADNDFEAVTLQIAALQNAAKGKYRPDASNP